MNLDTITNEKILNLFYDDIQQNIVTRTSFLSKEYYEEGKNTLKKFLENNSDIFNNWTTSNKQYVLVTNMKLVENDFEKTCGSITAHYEFFIYSNSVEDLKNIWQNFISKKPIDRTSQHFIADIKNKKIIEFVSVCM